MIRGEYEVAADVACKLGEGPLWHPDEAALYWTDIEGRRIYRLDPATGETSVAVEPGMRVGGMTLQHDGAILLFGDDGAIARLQGREVSLLLDRLPDEVGTRFNDVFADPEGRVFAGTMPKSDRLGRLYRIDPDLSYRVILEGIGCSNGMGLTPDGTGLYYTDTTVRRIYLFDYDQTTGELTNQRTALEFGEGVGYPDGMTVDAEGNLWVAFWGGSCVRCFAPNGEELALLELPAECVTCPVILPDGRMFVTTAGGDRRGEAGTLAGAVFVAHLGVAGVPESRSRLGEGAAS